MSSLFRLMTMLILLISFSPAAFAHHTEMSKAAASKLDAYKAVGPRVECLPSGYRRFYPLDNHHVIFKMGGGKIYLGETLPDTRCRGLVNGSFRRIARKEYGSTCRGDAVMSTNSGGFDRNCYFLWFQQLEVKKKR